MKDAQNLDTDILEYLKNFFNGWKLILNIIQY